MYEQKKISAQRLLLSKLHLDVDRIFQRSIIGELSADKPIWFMKCSLGHNVLTSLMARTPEAAGLKRHYTNHCVTATVATKLKNAGYENRAICKMTGHKNLQSLASYQKRAIGICTECPMLLPVRRHPPRTSAGLWRVAAAQPLAEEHALTLPKLFLSKNSVFHNIVINVGVSEPLAKHVCKGDEQRRTLPKLELHKKRFFITNKTPLIEVFITNKYLLKRFLSPMTTVLCWR